MKKIISYIFLTLTLILGCAFAVQAAETEHKPADIPGLTFDHSMDLSYAKEFNVDYYNDGYALLTIDQEGQFLVVPAKVEIKDKEATATIIWSSPNYDYMIVDGEKYEPVNKDGNSTFEIPVTVFDAEMEVTADTVAMSTPHEIEYTLNFDSSSMKKEEK